MHPFRSVSLCVCVMVILGCQGSEQSVTPAQEGATDTQPDGGFGCGIEGCTYIEGLLPEREDPPAPLVGGDTSAIAGLWDMGVDMFGSQRYFHYTSDGKPSSYTLVSADDNCYRWDHSENYPRQQNVFRPDTASNRSDIFLQESFYFHDDPYDDIPSELRRRVLRVQMWVENDRLYRKALEIEFSNYDFQLRENHFQFGDVGLPRAGISPIDLDICP